MWRSSWTTWFEPPENGAVLSATFKSLSNMKMVAAGSRGNFTHGQPLFIPCQGWGEPCLSHPRPSSCIKAGWIYWYQIRGEALRVELKVSWILTNTPLFSVLRLSICSTFCSSQHKFFNLPFMSSWSPPFCRRNPYKWDRKLECETSDTILICLAVNVTWPPPLPTLEDCQGTLKEPSGVFGLTREGRKVSVGANSPDTGEKKLLLLLLSEPCPSSTAVCPAMGQPSCLAAVGIPMRSFYSITFPSFSSVSERGWESWTPAWSGGLWGSPFLGLRTHKPQRLWAALLDTTGTTVDPHNQASGEF